MRLAESLSRHIIKSGEYEFHCLGIHPARRRIEVNEKTFAKLSELVQAFPVLLKHPASLAQCANFLFTGEIFKVIVDPDEFRKTYFFNDREESTTQFGKVDFTIFHSPKMEGDTFIYFVWNQVNDLPYRVVCAYPFEEQPDVRYELAT